MALTEPHAVTVVVVVVPVVILCVVVTVGLCTHNDHRRKFAAAAPLCPRSATSAGTSYRQSITRNGHDAAVLISPEDLAQLEETLSVLNDPEALADIREADAAYVRGDVLRGVEAVRRLSR